jgi:hypothetical protein
MAINKMVLQQCHIVEVGLALLANAHMPRWRLFPPYINTQPSPGQGHRFRQTLYLTIAILSLYFHNAEMIKLWSLVPISTMVKLMFTI